MQAWGRECDRYRLEEVWGAGRGASMRRDTPHWTQMKRASTML